MKKIEAYIKSERLNGTIKKLKEIGALGFTYYDVRGHGKEYEPTAGKGLRAGALRTLMILDTHSGYTSQIEDRDLLRG